MDYRSALEYLDGLGNEVLSMRFDLQNVRSLLAELGDPHLKFPSVLIAGTNGKGSVAATLASILRTNGFKTGLYTSPHLVRITERVAVDGEQIRPEEFGRLVGVTVDAIERLLASGRLQYRPTYFETVTAVAFKYFAESQVDIAVLEVGMGGRLDATNVVSPLCSLITTISYDHQAFLGDTLAKIAYEKAGIIKPGSTVITACDAREALDVIKGRCVELRAKLLHVRDACVFSAIENVNGRYGFDLQTPQGRYERVRLSLRGRHQIINCAVAILAAEQLSTRGFAMSREKVLEGVERTCLPARVQLIEGRPTHVLDGAHNVEAISALCSFLRENFKRKPILVFGAMRDKDIRGMGELIFPLAKRVILTRIDSRRSAGPDYIAEICADIRSDFAFASGATEALSLARSFCDDDEAIVVTGSFYLVGKMLDQLEGARALT